MNKQRLDKIISSQFNLSRREARRAVKIGEVTVNGKVIKDFGFQADIDTQKIEYQGNGMEYKEHIYIIMNKPKGVISASEDKEKKTVIDLIPENLRRQNLFPVGRLDKDTTGLLLITDDGEFSHSLLSPKKKITKTYRAVLDGDITEEMCKKFSEGIVLADGTKCKEAELLRIGECVAQIKITEGKYHQIKRMFGTVDLGVNELERIAIGGLDLPKDLESGSCRELKKGEIDNIYGV